MGGEHKGIEMFFTNAPEFSLPPAFRLLQEALHILEQSHFLKISDFSTDVANSYVIVYSKTTNNNYIAILEFYQAEESNISTLILGGKKL